ncbi:MAG TPA: hypothetical protein VED84_05125 [Acidimicrobiales bacterium]|nr:hypothetical protein [Acidimicrobiales bacterium]
MALTMAAFAAVGTLKARARASVEMDPTLGDRLARAGRRIEIEAGSASSDGFSAS